MLITEYLNSEELASEPFPHFGVQDLLPSEACQQLIDELPDWRHVTKGKVPGNNQRFNYTAADILQDSSISTVWKEFIRQHTTQEFLDQVVGLFRSHIQREHGHLSRRLDTLRAGVRHVDDFSTADVLLDAQLGINTPVKISNSVRGPHLDNPRKLFAALLYLRLPEDDSTGGDLQLYSPTSNELLNDDYEMPLEFSRVERTVKYRRNSLAMFLNTDRSFHGVTPRSVTLVPRVFVNFVAEFREPVFATRRRNVHEQLVA
jgi:hypothetical protein